jgi:carbamoyltransferase
MHHGDASAALVADGEVVFAVAEERLNRVKHYAGVPVRSIEACLRHAGASLADVDHVAIGRDRDANIAQKVRYALSRPANLMRFIEMRRRKAPLDDLRTVVASALDRDPSECRFEEHHVEHHLAHIASAFYCSDFDSAAGMSFDGSGDFVSTMLARCEGNTIDVLERVFVPHSLGSFYTMICDFIGYRKYGDEGKIMGLAAFGGDTFYEVVSDIVQPLPGGTFKLNPDFFKPLGSTQGMRIAADGTVHLARHYSDKMLELFGEPAEPHAHVARREMELASALQWRFEEVYFHLLNGLHARAPSAHLALAGGCALNSVANGKIFRRTPFEQTYIQPAAGDEGLAVGAALYACHAVLGQPRRHVLRNSYLGPSFCDEAIRHALDEAGLAYRKPCPQCLLDDTADAIAKGQVVGWFQGRMEWGPRALGNRSILAHPGHPGMKDILNSRIKHREWFRPFAPAVMAEHQAEYFEHDHPSPFMLHVYKIRADKQAGLSAVAHVDQTGRLQTVARDENPLFHGLIDAFRRKTGIPMVLNTSFNENEPIVCTPAEAIDCFRRTRMDLLAIGPYLAVKTSE